MSAHLHLAPALQRLLPALAQWRALYPASAEAEMPNLGKHRHKHAQVVPNCLYGCTKLQKTLGDARGALPRPTLPRMATPCLQRLLPALAQWRALYPAAAEREMSNLGKRHHNHAQVVPNCLYGCRKLRKTTENSCGCAGRAACHHLTLIQLIHAAHTV